MEKSKKGDEDAQKSEQEDSPTDSADKKNSSQFQEMFKSPEKTELSAEEIK